MEHTTIAIENGLTVEKNKIAYDTDKEAIKAARKMNLKGKQRHKAVAYKCKVCGKWHIGRNKTLLTDKEIKRLKKIDSYCNI